MFHVLRRLAERDEPESVRIDGEHFQIRPDSPRGVFQGFGGRRFIIAFHKGRVVETRNLWTQGKIPQHFRERLPDNAAFVDTDEVEKWLGLLVARNEKRSAE